MKITILLLLILITGLLTGCSENIKSKINSVKKTNRLVIVEEAWPLGAIATEVAFKVQKEAFDYLDAPVLRVTAADVPLPYAPTLIEASLPNVARVIKAVKEVMYVAK